MMDILEVYILSVAGLEALINEICLDKIDQRRERHKSIKDLKKLVDDYVTCPPKAEPVLVLDWRNKKGG